MENIYGYVYKTTNLINGKIYIGQHKSSSEKLDENYLGSGNLIQRAVEKYGKDNFKVELLDIAQSKEDLDEKEKYYIALYNTTDLLIGYNIADGGQGGFLGEAIRPKLHHVVTEEVRKRISNSKKGHPVSEETREKLSKKLKGRVFTEEQKRRMGDGHRGTKRSFAFRKKASENSVGNRGMHGYTDGVNYIMTNNPCPEGWWPGKPTSNRPKWHWYNNEHEELKIFENEEIPEGYTPGRLPKNSRKYDIYTNGFTSIKICAGSKIPLNFYKLSLDAEEENINDKN